ncbi:hypothetical protein MesoLj131a_35540 [Mesorhizobium sp. 131-2-1]|nr:hypothetical protein MesoLj131a_35540 [Mesorhizobium sp. 131-2-1]
MTAKVGACGAAALTKGAAGGADGTAGGIAGTLDLRAGAAMLAGVSLATGKRAVTSVSSGAGTARIAGRAVLWAATFDRPTGAAAASAGSPKSRVSSAGLFPASSHT